MFELIIACAVSAVVGYVARLYISKRWPDEQKLVDAFGTKYGEAVAAKIKTIVADAKARLDD